MIYLDYNATTPILPEVLEAMMPYLTSEWGNPSSSYKFGSKLKTVIETARAQVAELIGASTPEIIFTSCATESNNAAIHAALKAAPAKRHIITSAVEHSSVLNYCKALEKEVAVRKLLDPLPVALLQFLQKWSVFPSLFERHVLRGLLSCCREERTCDDGRGSFIRLLWKRFAL